MTPPSDKPALVTGATGSSGGPRPRGLVGGHIVRALRDAGYPVRALVRSASKATALRDLGCELAEGDMTDAASLQRAATGAGAVVHLVAIIAGKPDDFRRIMEQGTHDLVAAAQEDGVQHWVQMSALGTSEATKDLVPYFHAKWEIEQAVQASGIPYVIFRPSFVFAGDGGVLPR